MSKFEILESIAKYIETTNDDKSSQDYYPLYYRLSTNDEDYIDLKNYKGIKNNIKMQ